MFQIPCKLVLLLSMESHGLLAPQGTQAPHVPGKLQLLEQKVANVQAEDTVSQNQA